MVAWAEGLGRRCNQPLSNHICPTIISVPFSIIPVILIRFPYEIPIVPSLSGFSEALSSGVLQKSSCLFARFSVVASSGLASHCLASTVILAPTPLSLQASPDPLPLSVLARFNVAFSHYGQLSSHCAMQSNPRVPRRTSWAFSPCFHSEVKNLSATCWW